MDYERNRACDCMRCRCGGYMGPAILITIGVLFLLGEFTRFNFGDTWPVILIVIGVMKLLQWTAPATGHISRLQNGSGGGPLPPPPGGSPPPQSHSQSQSQSQSHSEDAQVPHG